MGFAKPSEHAGGAYFKPKEHMNDLVILVEPKTIERDVESEYKGKTRLRDEVTADITVFRDEGAVDKAEPTAVIKNAKVVHAMLTSTLEKILGEPMAARITETETRNGSGYVWRDVDSDIEDKVVAYYEKREEAIASAVADAPDFE